MGGSAASEDDVRSYYESRSEIGRARSVQEVCRETSMLDLYNPAKMKLPREARDSALSPRSRGIILAEDVTGSMGSYILDLIQNQFPKLIREIYKISSYNPHIMFMGVGDAEAGDRAPLQATQFETDLRMLEQLQQIWIEGRGGGNRFESYILPWYFAATCTSMDCYEKRGEKGFLFTFGDEEPTPYMQKHDLQRVFGNREDVKLPQQSKIYFDDCLEMASEKFYCYHILLHGNGYYYYYDSHNKWKEKMGGHACDLSDHEYVAELVITILKMYEGLSKTEAISTIKNPSARAAIQQALEDHEEMVEVSTPNEQSHANIEEF